MSERITAILDLDELLPSVVQLIQEHFGYHPVHIFTQEAGDELRFHEHRPGRGAGPAARTGVDTE
ncbi:MAG: hypothetical protein U0074_02340 [Kouleothrix sp.]